MNKKYYVYRHFNKEKGVFYIGLGSTKCRSHTKRNRNRYWLNIVNKYGFIVEILKNDLTKDDAIELECFLISQYGRIDLKTGCLVNMTCGGDGINELSEESELKRREKLKNVVIIMVHMEIGIGIVHYCQYIILRLNFTNFILN